MNLHTQRLQLQGLAGNIELLRDNPLGPPIGTAIIAHPHPLFGGTMDNKVVQTLTRAHVNAGWTVLRFNFRGVGLSEGLHDEGRGEVDDMLAVIKQLAPTGRLALAGFSFGSFVTSWVMHRLNDLRAIDSVVFVGTATTRFEVAQVSAAHAACLLIVHGLEDDTVPLASVWEWAKPQNLPVTVFPSAGHFFHGQLPALRQCVERHLSANLSATVGT